MNDEKPGTSSALPAGSSPSTKTAKPSPSPSSSASTRPSSPSSLSAPPATRATAPAADHSSSEPFNDLLTFNFTGIGVSAELNGNPLDILSFSLHWTKPYTLELSAIVTKSAPENS